jgi:uncharacterized repeat protein (TIGR03806 family)
MRNVLLGLIALVLVLIACSKEVPDYTDLPTGDPQTRVIFDMDEVPYPVLSTYKFFKGNMADQEPAYGVLPFTPISTLFTDYAKKKRFVWMPAGVKATYDTDHSVLNFPDGAVLIKNFYYDHVQPGDVTRILETRLIFKRNGTWEFADYVWNEAQTEATLDMSGSNVDLTWVDGAVTRSTTYRIPSEAECLTCHKINGTPHIPVPIGVKPQSLNGPLQFEDGVKNQLEKWVEMGYLDSSYPKNILTVVRWDDPTQDLTERVRSYVDINCAHCHTEGRHCDYRPMRFAYYQNHDLVNMGVCVVPHEFISPALTHIVAAGNYERSVLHYRLNATDETVRMPLLGRTLVHEEAVAMMEEWISSLTPPCE